MHFKLSSRAFVHLFGVTLLSETYCSLLQIFRMGQSKISIVGTFFFAPPIA